MARNEIRSLGVSRRNLLIVGALAGAAGHPRIAYRLNATPA